MLLLGLALFTTPREKCPNTELFLVRIFLYSDWMFSPNTKKYGPEITPYLDTFHAVIVDRVVYATTHEISTFFGMKLKLWREEAVDYITSSVTWLVCNLHTRNRFWWWNHRKCKSENVIHIVQIRFANARNCQFFCRTFAGKFSFLDWNII